MRFTILYYHSLLSPVKDGPYYCYGAYVLRISRYSDVLWAVLINTGIFLRDLKLWGKGRTSQVLLVS